jgi:hypothetical protein
VVGIISLRDANYLSFIHHVAFLYQVIPEDVVKSLLAGCTSGEFDVANKEVSNIIADGYPVSQLISQVISFSFIYIVIL